MLSIVVCQALCRTLGGPAVRKTDGRSSPQGLFQPIDKMVSVGDGVCLAGTTNQTGRFVLCDSNVIQELGDKGKWVEEPEFL